MQNLYAQEIIVHGNEISLIGQKTKYIEDVTNSKSWKVILQSQSQHGYCKQKAYGGKPRHSTGWFYFQARNLSEANAFIDVRNSNITNLKFYKINANGVLVDSSSNSAFNRSFTHNNGYTFWFPIAKSNDTSSYQFLLSIRTPAVFDVPIFIGTHQALSKNQNANDYLSLFFIGAVLIMFIYNVALFFMTKDNIYLYYAAYLMSFVIVTTFLNNFPFIEIIVSPTFIYNHIFCWLGILLVCTSFFTIKYFNLKIIAPFFYKVLIIEIVLTVIIAIGNIWISSTDLLFLFETLTIIFYITCVVICFNLLYKGNQRALLYCIAWSGMLLSLIAYLAEINRILPHSYFLRNATYFGSLFEILILSFALGALINSSRKKEIKLNSDLTLKNNTLSELNDSLDAFNYHVSHDLKTTLTNTKALSTMIKKYNVLDKKEKVNEIADRLFAVSENGIETVKGFLAIAKTDQSLKNDEFTSLILKTEINSVLDNYDLRDKLNLSFGRMEFDTIKMHLKGLESIFLNFFTNSIKYSDSFPTIFIEWYFENSHAIITFKDNGIGFDTDKYGKSIFDAFQMIPNHINAEGTGVGLYLVKRIVDSYGGSIQVDSKTGEGSTFQLKFNRDNI